MDLPFNRAWAATEKFTDSGFRLDDKNRSAGLFYVTYLGPEGEENGGWFSWLGGSKREDPLVGQEFRVQLTAEDTSQVTIHILGSDGESIGQLVQQGLLTLLQGNIT